MAAFKTAHSIAPANGVAGASFDKALEAAVTAFNARGGANRHCMQLQACDDNVGNFRSFQRRDLGLDQSLRLGETDQLRPSALWVR